MSSRAKSRDLPQSQTSLTVVINNNKNKIQNQTPYHNKSKLYGFKKEATTLFNLSISYKPPQKIMDITKLIGDLGFPIVVSLILIYRLDYKLDQILKEIREIKNEK